ncbi:MAG TPA: glycosyl transferase [Brevibacillus sp.]|uniref:Glycosyltransferase 2-like domain-containing protein n=1 Tax=Brevibacillus parabrevis TaxID=54914 RepID=A0A4Y3PSC9_BREPA|nr:glycosyltransferase [Brevibacillus sp. HD1.4A]NRQ55320.1 glycosyltransferase [Brevibacillus sp. HD1.4A]RNB92800.1 glycosyltransferase [Brevibacillus parabrevis]GEB34876.1 hypothetical protein BPA01_44560 [Brevibacillus parabrevis]HBZ82251.1 glycosyl transferase [Brevibacillus sp.]
MDGVPNGKKGPRESARERKDTKGVRISHVEKWENQGRLSIIVGVEQDEKTVLKVLKQAEKLCPLEIVVVVHGSQDRSLEQVLSYSGSALRIFVYPFALGEDVWRTVGAREATGDVWLFLAAEQIVAAHELQPFVRSCYRGGDIAVRHAACSPVRVKEEQYPVQLAKQFLNSLLNRSELGGASMNDLPFAITREAASSIGAHYFLVPAVAQAIALQKELRVTSIRTRIERLSGKEQRITPERDAQSKLTDLGDHLEAISFLQQPDE